MFNGLFDRRTQPPNYHVIARSAKRDVAISWYNLSESAAKTNIVPGDSHVGLYRPPRNDIFGGAVQQPVKLKFEIIRRTYYACHINKSQFRIRHH